MSSRPNSPAPPTRPPIRRRFTRTVRRPSRLIAAPRRIFPRRLDRPAFKRRSGPTFNSFLSLGITLGLVVILTVAVVTFERIFDGRVIPHVSVDGIALGGVSLADASTYLQRQEEARAQQPILLHAGEQTYQITSKQFDARHSAEAALASAVRDGHDGDLLTRIWNQIQIMAQGHNYLISGSHDQAAVRSYLVHLDTLVTVAPKPAVVGVRGGEVAILHEPVPGRRLDREAAARVLSKALDTHTTFDINLPLQTTVSPISHQAAQGAVRQGQELLSQPMDFSYGTKSRHWELKPNQLVRLLTFITTFTPKGYSIVMGIDTKKLAEAMAPIAAAVDHPPQDAYFTVAPGGGGTSDSAIAQPDGVGLSIDYQRTAQLLLGSIAQHTVIIPPIHPHAAFDLAAARALNIDTEQGRGGGGWADSSATRIANIVRASDVHALGNIRLNPGQTLSVTAAISPVVQLNGYSLDLNQIAKTDVSGVNGGTTQVASAVFQAAYAAGLPIEQRTNYPYLTAFNGPFGEDAMVAARAKGPDLQFTNNTKHVLLIVVRPVVVDGTVTAYMFNNNIVNRKVQLGVPTLTVNQDGSVDTTISRTISGDTTGQDAISSHYGAMDAYP